jgi:hypothetical protein
VLDLFHARGVRPIVLKGWAAARLHPDPAVRPPGDLDLCVRPEEESAARAAIAAVTEDCAVDLHVGLRLLDDRSPEEIWRRCEEVDLEGGEARVLGREDHLREAEAARFGFATTIRLATPASRTSSAPPWAARS